MSELSVPFMNSGVNPRCLHSCQLWQTDVTHVPSFSRHKYVQKYVLVDTFSGAVFVSAHAGETVKFTKRHFLLAFAALGVPQQIKTDNGPAYVFKPFKTFFQQWGVKHSTGIPHSPRGQSIVERTHQKIKWVLHQQQGGIKTLPPVERLYKALYVINFLNCSNLKPNPFEKSGISQIWPEPSLKRNHPH